MWRLFQVEGGVRNRVVRPRLPVDGELVWSLPLGLGVDGDVLCWDSREQPNLLVADSTGIGGTVLAAGVVLEAVRRRWQVWICDLDADGLTGLGSWPFVERVASSADGVASVIAGAHTELVRRQTLAEAGTECRFQPVLLVVDLHEYLEELDARYSVLRTLARTTVGPALAQLRCLAEGGPTVNVQVLLAAKRTLVDAELSDVFETQVRVGPLPGNLDAVDAEQQEVESLRAFWQPLPNATDHSPAAP